MPARRSRDTWLSHPEAWHASSEGALAIWRPGIQEASGECCILALRPGRKALTARWLAYGGDFKRYTVPLLPVTKSERDGHLPRYWTAGGIRQKNSGSWSSLVPLGISHFFLRSAGWGLEGQGRAQNCPVACRKTSIPRSHYLCLSTGVADYCGFTPRMAGSVPVSLSDWSFLSHRPALLNPTKGEDPPAAL